MPLSAEQIYNDLNGEQVREILLIRCADLLNQVSEFQRHLTLPRVRMSINIHLEVVGRTPPTFDIADDLVVRMRDVPSLPEFPPDRCRVCGWPLATDFKAGCVSGNCSQRPVPSVRADDGFSPSPTSLNLEAVINSDTNTQDGQPPDQIREEHGLPTTTPKRGPYGIEDVEVPADPARIKYAFNVTQDYGPARSRTGMEGPVIGGEVIGGKNAGAAPDFSPDFGKVKDNRFADKYDSLDINGQK